MEDREYGSFAPHSGNSRELSRIKCQSISRQEAKREDGSQETYLDNFISRELQKWNVCSVACHKISIQYSQHTFMRNDEEIILFTLKFQDDRLETHS